MKIQKIKNENLSENEYAVNVGQADCRVVFYEDDDFGDVLVETNGVNPCIVIVVKGQKASKAGGMEPDKFITVYHWEGGLPGEIKKAWNQMNKKQLNDKEKQTFVGSALVLGCWNFILNKAGTENQGAMVRFDECIVIGGGRQVADSTSGTEMQMQAWERAISQGNLRLMPLRTKYVPYPYGEDDERSVDLAIGISDEDSLFINYIITDNTLDFSPDEKSSFCPSDIVKPRRGGV